MEYIIKCDHGDYTTGPIDSPFGIPSQLVAKAIEWHQRGHKGHVAKVVPLGK